MTNTNYSCGCGSRGPPPTKLIEVDGVEVGIIGMDEVFEVFFQMKKTPEDIDGDKLLNALNKRNYIPKGSEIAYKEAFLREYSEFYQNKIENSD